MRQIIRRREIVADDWRYAGEEGADLVHCVQPLAAFIEVAKAGTAPAAAAGVRVGPTDEVATLAPYLDRIALLVIDFPKAGDGRGFSQGTLLRQRYRYTGELRAAGALKRDQLFFLARCGFDAFDLDPTEDLAASLNAFNTFSVAYQHGNEAIVRPRERAPRI